MQFNSSLLKNLFSYIFFYFNNKYYLFTCQNNLQRNRIALRSVYILTYCYIEIHLGHKEVFLRNFSLLNVFSHVHLAWVYLSHSNEHNVLEVRQWHRNNLKHLLAIEKMNELIYASLFFNMSFKYTCKLENLIEYYQQHHRIIYPMSNSLLDGKSIHPFYTVWYNALHQKSHHTD